MTRKLLVVVIFLLVGALTVVAQEQPTPVPAATGVVQKIQVNQNGIQFIVDADLVDAVSVTTYAATEDDSAMIPSPAFTEFTFDGYGEGNYMDYAPMPRVDIYPIEGFGDYPVYAEQLDLLTGLLAERPDLDRYVIAGTNGLEENILPFLPIFNAAQVFRVHPQYIENANLQGIRYLVYYSQSMNPIVEGEVFYTFQGITADGQHYVSAILPINTSVIPADAPAIEDPDAFAAEYESYLNDILSMINAADTDNFMPSLYTLDLLVQSIQVR